MTSAPGRLAPPDPAQPGDCLRRNPCRSGGPGKDGYPAEAHHHLRGGLGTRSLNIDLQTALNPPGEIRVERFGWTFCPGDKVMQVENDYDKEVYNGDLGVVSRIDMEESALIVDFDGRELIYGFGELDELVLAYATTIHKSQGSEYLVVKIKRKTPGRTAEICARPSILWVPSV